MIARALIVLFAGLVLANAGYSQDDTPVKSAVVVELFTSQGCANCAIATELLEDLSTQKDVVALSFAVDYWDYLGWRDTFASPEFTERQYAYGKILKHPRIYTPQIVINGHMIYKGVLKEKIRRSVEQHKQKPNDQAPVVQASLNAKGEIVLDIAGTTKTDAAIWMAAYTPGEQFVLVKDGDNKGKKLAQVNMVTGLTRLADWNGGHTRMVLPMPKEGGCAILVQAAGQGPILAATKIEL